VEALSDETLLAAMGAGDADAAAVFVRRFQSRVYGLALTMLRDPGIAEDVHRRRSCARGGTRPPTTPAAGACRPGC